MDTLGEIDAGRGAGSSDLAFVDADKANYPAYYEATLRLLRPGGKMLLDNMLFLGRVIDPSNQDAGVLAIRQLNEDIRHDQRVDQVMLPISDGLTLVRRR